MPVRLRITLLFSITVCGILLAVCLTVYYIAYTSRINFIKTRLLNRASYTNTLLSRAEVFSSGLVARLDTSITGLIRSKEVRVYDENNDVIYEYSDIPSDTLQISNLFLYLVRYEGSKFFNYGQKEVMAVHYPDSGFVVVSATRDDAGKKYLSQLKTTVWLSLIGGVLISFGVGYFFAGRLLRPVKQITDEVNEISAKSLTRRIPTGRSRDEWYYLSNTLNQLLNRLQRSFEVQRRFIANASHELCTPLTSISNQLEVSLQRNRDADHYREVITSTLQDVMRMGRLTQALLELARASGSQSGLEIDHVRIDEVLLQLPADMSKLNSSWEVVLRFGEMPVEEEQVLVFGNEELLVTAIRNIVMNACKYSPDHQAVVGLEIIPGEIHISISDNGPGIEQAEIENIFLPFYRTGSVGSTTGFGLGLSLANHIIQLHNGHIRVNSDAKSGSVFTIFLPQAVGHHMHVDLHNVAS
ncbi:MAG: HAMP domain-containing histidine kinase [Chitinophagaceae bacterium]|nr:HAMP domain-containing histidine kinase [Chitinophagaceae bacterium]